MTKQPSSRPHDAADTSTVNVPLAERPAQVPTNWMASVWAVLWGFLGVRRKSDYEQDIHTLRPLPLMLVGFVLTVLFVGGLMALVHWLV